MSTVLYFDMFCGISGDMCAGAFLDLGLDRTELTDLLSHLPLENEYSLSFETKQTNGMSGIDFKVNLPEAEHSHRTMGDIEDMLKRSSLPQKTRETALCIFTVLAGAEGRVHHQEWRDVHFHEAGAVDSIIDIVACSFAIEYFDITSCYSSPFRFGTGTVECRHGTLPVPVPAVVELTRGSSCVFTEIPTELTTPTGAAIIRALVDTPGGHPPEFTVSHTGLGCGDTSIEGMPNMLRIIAGDSLTAASPLVELTTDIDDSTPETVGYLFGRILSAGALDCTAAQILMKKGRPGYRITVLCTNRESENLKRILFRETSTFGIRETPAVRSKLKRESVSVTLSSGTVSCSIGYLDNEIVTVSPEYEDCRKIGERSGIPLKNIYAEAAAKAEELIKRS